MGRACGAGLLFVFAVSCSDPDFSTRRTLRDVEGIEPTDGGNPVDAGNIPSDARSDPSISFLTPAASAHFPKDQVQLYSWSARVEFTVEASGVSAVRYSTADGDLLGTASVAPFAVHGYFEAEASVEIIAAGLDAGGNELVRTTIAITIGPPTDSSCHAMLDALGLDWEVANPRRGIEDPVTVGGVIHGVGYRYLSDDEGDWRDLTMDCSLAPRLAVLSEILLENGLDEVIHIGIYNYRCIGGGDPDVDDCTPSQHAYARAIDLAGFGAAESDETYVVLADWIEHETATCPAFASEPKDELLHEIICKLFDDRVFNILLTPNYNDAHRDHFHVDLTPRSSSSVHSGFVGLDPLFVPNLGD